MHSMIGSGKTGLVTNDSKFLTQTQGFMNVLYLINVHSQRAISGWPVQALCLLVHSQLPFYFICNELKIVLCNANKDV